MPDWCLVSLRVSGEQPEVEAFAKRARGTDPNTGGELPIDYRKFVPVPPEVERAPYDPVGYNWRLENWGVKWETSSDRFESASLTAGEAVYEFLTPWHPPTEWAARTAALFPQLRFTLASREEDMGFQDCSVWEGGKLNMEA